MQKAAFRSTSWASWYRGTIRQDPPAVPIPEIPADEQTTEEQNRERLVRSHLLFVMSLARDYENKGLHLEDLVAEGNIGLLRAARRFDPSRGVKFATLAAWWIRKSMLMALYRHYSMVRIPE